MYLLNIFKHKLTHHYSTLNVIHHKFLVFSTNLENQSSTFVFMLFFIYVWFRGKKYLNSIIFHLILKESSGIGFGRADSNCEWSFSSRNRKHWDRIQMRWQDSHQGLCKVGVWIDFYQNPRNFSSVYFQVPASGLVCLKGKWRDSRMRSFASFKKSRW